MSDLNVITISGRLVADPQLRFTPKGTAVASIRVASSRSYKDKNDPTGEWKQRKLFITAETFGRMAEGVAARRKKADLVILRGRLELNEWLGNDGKKNQTYRIMADEINFVPPGKPKTGGEADKDPSSELADGTEGEIPF